VGLLEKERSWVLKISLAISEEETTTAGVELR